VPERDASETLDIKNKGCGRLGCTTNQQTNAPLRFLRGYFPPRFLIIYFLQFKCTINISRKSAKLHLSLLQSLFRALKSYGFLINKSGIRGKVGSNIADALVNFMSKMVTQSVSQTLAEGLNSRSQVFLRGWGKQIKSY
jgi:hypothetical protein